MALPSVSYVLTRSVGLLDERCHVFHVALSTIPLPPIHATPQAMSHLNDLKFVPVPPSRPVDTPFPSTPTLTHRSSTSMMSPARPQSQVNHSPGKAAQRSPGKGSVPKARVERRSAKADGQLYLVSSFVDFGDCKASIFDYYYCR